MGKIKVKDIVERGVSHIYPNKRKFENLIRRKKIRLYQGFDPSMPNLHLGNMVGLMKLAQFQQMGHEVIFLVGDFTGMIGDPTDKLESRKKLTREEVLTNTKNWKKQASRILNFDGSNAAKIMYNSSWLDKISYKDLIEITSNFTVQQMIERDMFQKRLSKNEPIFLHEFLYPVAVSIDCVMMNVDLEIGGSDQLFNMMAGRTLMKAMKGKDKYVLTTKLLVDKEGNKVGKTTGNALFLNTTAKEFYAGIMSFPDEVLHLAYELLTDTDLTDLNDKISQDPLTAKKGLAYTVTKKIHGKHDADIAQKYFETTFQERQIPQDLKVKKVSSPQLALLDLIWETRLIASRSQIKRLIEDGAIEIDGEALTNPTQLVNIGKSVIIKIGKSKFIKAVPR
jgi:tyrosyl-tRNA synthetase